MKISFICRNYDGVKILLAKINVKLNIIGTKDTKLKRSSIRNANIELNDY